MKNKQQKYLNKVVNQLVSETTIDGDGVTVPFSLLHNILPLPLLISSLSSPFLSFSRFVIEVYGLTEEEVKYVWEQYRDIINNRI